MFKKSISKMLIKINQVMVIIFSTVGEVVVFIPSLIYGLINGLSLKVIFKVFWVDGFYVSLKQYLKELELD